MNLPSPRSLAARVTLLATLAVGVAVAVVAIAAFFTVRHQMRVNFDQSLLSRASAAARSQVLTVLTAQRVPSWTLGAADVQIGFVNARGQWLTMDRGPGLPIGAPETAVARGQRPYSIRTVVSGDGDFRLVAVPTTERGSALFLAQSLEPTENTLDAFGLVMLVFGGAGVVVAGLAGWGVAHNGLRPVRSLTRAAEHIARTEELRPIQVEGHDEIARLASAFNAMLAALAASRDRQRQLVADASHELRTPLTSLRTNLDLLTQADRQGGLAESSRRELMEDVRFQIEELTTLVGDLVALARDEPLEQAVEPVDLAEVTMRAVERVRHRAPNLHFAVDTRSWWVTGEADDLERAVTNLLDNAAKWSPPLGVVTVSLRDGTLQVSDQGPGIAAEDLPHVFDRFYRSKESRTMPGSGLGLAIVRQVAERHGGSVRAGRSADDGAAIWFTVPGAPVPPDSEAGAEAAQPQRV